MCFCWEVPHASSPGISFTATIWDLRQDASALLKILQGEGRAEISDGRETALGVVRASQKSFYQEILNATLGVWYLQKRSHERRRVPGGIVSRS